jgi:alkanesulfonate monooxygenase SsuD/methylene tetrahydromethanopterin reductase-like flavin-dependent oxidoreductase (luciferase family)
MQVSLFGLTGDFEEIAAQVVTAEEAGFDAVLFGEHHGASMHRHPQLLILLAGLAARTSRIKLGTSIVLGALYDPVHLAEMSAMVDRNSGGRLILGLGLGYQPQDFAHFGIRFGQRVSRFEECIEVLRRAWSEDRFSFAGRHHVYEDVAVHPKPLQQPHPPLWLAAWSEAGAARAGRLGDAYVTDPIQSLAAISAFNRAYRPAAAAAGRAARVVVMREILCAPSRQLAIERYGAGLEATYRYYWENNAFVLDWDDHIEASESFDSIGPDRLMQDRVILGSPSECVSELTRWCEQLDANHVQLVVPPGRSERALDDRLATIRMLGAEVAAPLRAR